MPQRQIKRALISVYDKTGIVEFAQALVEEFGIEVISTGGTAKLLTESGVPVTLVEDITGFPEMLDGRVKTLHPKIHAAILADRDNPEHMRQLKEQGIEPIDMVVVNLYPFETTVADPDCTFEQAIEMIDIGGPCLLRAAAKNHRHVLVVTGPSLYLRILQEFRGATAWQPKSRALIGYSTTACYDAGIVNWLQHLDPWPTVWTGVQWHAGDLGYGENPHQTAARYRDIVSGVECTTFGNANSSALSFNNVADAHAALELGKELTRCGTGFQPVISCGTGLYPVRNSGFQPLEEERHTRRNLPHIQNPGHIYFVTFRLKEAGELAPSERDVVLRACRYWDGSKMDLHAAVVMPDHVHLLLTPRESAAGHWVPLGEIVHSIKRHSALRINEVRGSTGALWQDEYFDRIMRNKKEFEETWSYIANNPVSKDLAEAGKYPWFWDGSRRGQDLERGDAQLDRPTHRMKSGATAEHRLETGATDPKICIFIKHTNACGVGMGGDPIEAYRRAYLGDPNAAMGGILACNFNVDAEFAAAVMDSYGKWGKQAGAGGFFVEVWIAPEFADDAVDHIRKAKAWGQRVRLLSVGDMSAPPNADEVEYKSITGGMLVQSRDLVALNEDQWKVVTKRGPTDSEMSDLRLAWLVAKHTKSNAISICKDGMLIGNGAGQMSRVMSCRIATWLAKENGHAEKLKGSAAASDAFFPFPDGPNLLIDAGVTAIIQPGGSKRDEDTIAACNERDVAMIFTGTRHFKH